MKINVIVTYSNNLVIGNDTIIPWNYEEITKYFEYTGLHSCINFCFFKNVNTERSEMYSILAVLTATELGVL